MLGRKEICNNLIGGIRAVYIMDFKKHPIRSIVLNSEKTILKSFPVTGIYKYELRGDTDFSQTFNNDEGIYYDQSIEIALRKDDVPTLNQVRNLLNKETRLIIEDYNGNKYMMGLYNGANLTDYKRSTGGAKGDFNGYNLTFEAQEINPAPFIENLNNSGFIEEIADKNFWYSSDPNILASTDKLSSEIYI